MQDPTPMVHISVFALLGAIALTGFYTGRMAHRFRLPALIGYMFVGVILGPSVLNVMTRPILENLSFMSEIALGMVAFTIGSELSLSSLRRFGSGIVSIIFASSFLAFGLVVLAVYLLTRDFALSLILGALAPASAPAGTVAVIQEYKAEGSLTKALYAVVGFDDGLAIIIFGFAAALAKNILLRETASNAVSVLPVLWGAFREIALSIFLGGLLGTALCQVVRKLRKPSDILIVTVGVVLMATGLSLQWHLSLILTNMMVGMVLVNSRKETLVRVVMAPLSQIMPLVFLFFFCLAGAHLELMSVPALGTLGGVYILGRSAGKMAGARLGALVGRVEEKIKKYLGLGILSQAGVAIGLALIAREEFSALGAQYDLPRAEAMGVTVLTTITATCVVFEIIGPILTRVALRKARELPEDEGS